VADAKQEARRRRLHVARDTWTAAVFLERRDQSRGSGRTTEGLARQGQDATHGDRCVAVDLPHRGFRIAPGERISPKYAIYGADVAIARGRTPRAGRVRWRIVS